MASLKWTRANDVFLPEVDAEHRNLFRLAEELQRSVAAGAESVRLQSQMSSLIGCVEEHFRHEERLMRAARCESYAWHRRQHDTLRRKAADFSARFEAGDADALSGFLEFFFRWFQDHTALPDRMMASQVRNAARLP